MRYGVVTFSASQTAEERVNLVQNAVPKSTQYKNKWAYGIFEEWQRQRLVKVSIVEFIGLFKNYAFHQVESLETPLVEMSAFKCALFKYEKVSEMKSGQVSDILAPKCSSTSNVSFSRDVSETTLEVGSSANTCEFMSSAHVNRLSKCE